MHEYDFVYDLSICLTFRLYISKLLDENSDCLHILKEKKKKKNTSNAELNENRVLYSENLVPFQLISAEERASIETATVHFFTSVISSHILNQMLFAKVLYDVIKEQGSASKAGKYTNVSVIGNPINRVIVVTTILIVEKS